MVTMSFCKRRNILAIMVCCVCAGILTIVEYQNSNQIRSLEEQHTKQLKSLEKHMIVLEKKVKKGPKGKNNNNSNNQGKKGPKGSPNKRKMNMKSKNNAPSNRPPKTPVTKSSSSSIKQLKSPAASTNNKNKSMRAPKQNSTNHNSSPKRGSTLTTPPPQSPPPPPPSSTKQINKPPTSSSSSASPPPPPSPSSLKKMNKTIDLNDFRMCRVDHPKPTLNGPPVHVNGTVMPVEYQCDGEPYNQFADLLEQLISNQARVRDPAWGRRRVMVPQHCCRHDKRRAVLILGNSHTRQLVTALLCQYRDQIIDSKMLYSMPQNPAYGVWEIHLQGNLTIYSATNCPFIYSPNWYETLENMVIHRPLHSLDAIVAGNFNRYSESTGTKFYQNIMEYQNAFPELGIDFEHAPVPSLADIAKVYAGPIVYVSMFAKYGKYYLQEAREAVVEIGETSSRNNLAVVDGRKYVMDLQQVIQKQQGTSYSSSKTNLLQLHECSTDGRDTVNTCVTDPSSYRFRNGHRCTGSRGGHPDLIAWDVVDALHELLKHSSKKSQ